MTTVLVCLLVLYNAWLVTYLLWEKRQGAERPEADEPQPQGRTADPTDVVGRSLFRMTEKVPTPATSVPQAATYGESEEVEEEDVTFADETDGTPPEQIPDDQLDDAFSDLRITDVPVEYDGDGPKKDATVGYASGATFEEIDKAVRTAKNPSASEEEQRNAGKVFSQMEGNELFDRLTNMSSIGSKITGLMDLYLNKPVIPKGGRKEVRQVQPQPIPVMPDTVEGFNIRDFV
ncbi:hypothetical protein [Bacteroides oleiciplenus]|uniref:Conjugal transfer protein TraD n=1 Tax=Bacteroides oleiciplenus YIT 12058 TaxID=742727 RepID=K9EHW5_9BACE|nr:hypothetical protein [Bacteroides oleiciplenus]EKU88750.1 hypothetical protein HMPREF9447_04068 [Bacteroides oleiciplenus YIT 12058]